MLRQRGDRRGGLGGPLYAREDALWLREISAQEAAPLPRPVVSDGRNGWNRPVEERERCSDVPIGVSFCSSCSMPLPTSILRQCSCAASRRQPRSSRSVLALIRHIVPGVCASIGQHSECGWLLDDGAGERTAACTHAKHTQTLVILQARSDDE
jgi:hypothetical protein